MEGKGSTFVEFEKGIDHIADLDLQGRDLDEIVYMNDVWQMYRLRFTVFSHEDGD